MPTNNANIGITYIDATTPPLTPSDDEVYFCKQSESIWVGETQHSIGPLEHDITTYSFDDGIDSYFKKVVSTIVPVQAGSGTPSPNNQRPISGFTECTVINRSNNIFDIDATHTQAFTYIYRYDITVEPNTAYICASDIPQTSPASIYFNGSSSSDNGVCIDTPRIVTSGADGKLYVLVRYSDVGGGYDAYTAIKNGTYTLTLAKVSTATISFGSAGTVYGGYVDLISGKLVVNIVYNKGNWTKYAGPNANGYNAYRKTFDYRKIGGVTLSNMISIFGSFNSGTVNQNMMQPNTITDRSCYLALHEDYNAEDVEYAYELATPIEYQLTPAQLRSLVGANRLTSSTGEVTEVEYIRNETISWVIDQIQDNSIEWTVIP